MTAQELIAELLVIGLEHDLSKVYVNYRWDDDSDVHSISSVEEDLFDKETNSKLISICLKSISPRKPIL